MSSSQRLHILPEEDIEALYARPEFNDEERIHFFSLPPEILTSLKIKDRNGKNTSTKLYFILQYGYFKAKHQFFKFSYEKAKKDITFVMRNYLSQDILPHKLPTRKVQRQTKNSILKLMKFTDDTEKSDQLILKKVDTLAKTTQKPVEIFNETVKALETKRYVLPSYSRLQDKIGAGLKKEDQRLIMLVKRHLTKRAEKALRALFQSDEKFYAITALQFDARSFRTKEMKAELKKLSLCKPIYDFAKHFLPKLALSRHLMDYYSDLAKLYSMSRLKKIARELAYVYLICYVQHRCEQFINNFVQAFIYHVDKYDDDSKKYVTEHLPMQESQLEQYNPSIGKLILFYTDKKILELSGEELQKLAFKVMSEKKIISVGQTLLSKVKRKKEQERKLTWEFHKTNFQALLINLRPLFLAIDFEGYDSLKDIFKATQFLKSLFNQGKKITTIPFNRIPIDHIKPKVLLSCFTHTIVVNKKKNKTRKIINIYQYEYYLYHMLRDNLRKNKVYINNSTGYKSFEAEVKIDPNWDKKEKKILKNLNNDVLLRPIDDTLDALEAILEPLIQRTNERAQNGENKNIKITHHRDGSVDWTTPYSKMNDEIDNPFYKKHEVKTFSWIFDVIEKECHFMEGFRHIKPREAQGKKDYQGIKAVLMANGTMQGRHLFSKRSNLDYQRLKMAEKNFIRLETVRDAADILVNNLINLPLFESYLLSGKRHGNIDGTKRKLRRRLTKARHSPKYFGLDIGEVIMTMSLGHLPFVTEMIGANEHESHYLYPMLMRNSSNIDLDIISTDTEGSNNVNDFLYYLIGKTHAPCYRSLPKKAKNICGFKPLTHYENCLIKPSSQVDKKLIKKKWPELLPVLVALLSHETKQENIIKKLSSHDYKSELKDAFWELNRILKSIHILKYIDDPVYQTDIRISLNRGEAYHQLLHKIADVGGGDFRGMTDLEVEIWNECNRFMALITIYYNMHLLSKLYDAAVANKDTAALEFLKHLSPVASQHVIFGGLYEFSDVIDDSNIDDMVELFRQILKETVQPSAQEEKKKRQTETVL